MQAIPNETNPYDLSIVLVNDTLVIDNSRLECFTTCPRLAQYRILDKKTFSKSRIALEFGKAIHKALEVRYVQTDINNETGLLDAQVQVLQKEFEQIVVPPDDFRTLDRAIETMQLYNAYYSRESFKVLAYNGKPFVEQSFAVPLGQVGGYKVIWTGRIDMLVEDDQGIFIFDHKTTSVLGTTFFKDFVLASGVTGYNYSVRKILGKPVRGTIINAIANRKGSKSGTPTEFSREKVYQLDQHLKEWEQDMLHIASDFLHNIKRGYFPKHTKWCMGKYGACEFFEVCSLPPEQRNILLNSDMYATDNWSPIAS